MAKAYPAGANKVSYCALTEPTVFPLKTELPARLFIARAKSSERVLMIRRVICFMGYGIYFTYIGNSYHSMVFKMFSAKLFKIRPGNIQCLYNIYRVV